MKYRWMKVLALPVCVLLILGIGGCALQQSPAKPTDGTKIRLGIFPNITHSPALVGIDQGFFRQAMGNVELDVKVFHAGPELMEAMAAGEVDMAYVGPGPALTGWARGMPVCIVAGANEGGAVLVATADADIAKVDDLAGKKVAIPQFGNTQDITLRHLLSEHGLKDKAKGGNVTIIQAAPADVLIMFVRGQVDAALLPEPWGSVLEKKGGARLVLNWNEIWHNGQYPTTVLLVDKLYAERYPAVVQAFIKGHAQAVEFIGNNQRESLQSISRQLKLMTNKELPEDILLSAFNRSRATTALNPCVLQEFADLSVEAGYLKHQVAVEQIISRPFAGSR